MLFTKKTCKKTCKQNVRAFILMSQTVCVSFHSPQALKQMQFSNQWADRRGEQHCETWSGKSFAFVHQTVNRSQLCCLCLCGIFWSWVDRCDSTECRWHSIRPLNLHLHLQCLVYFCALLWRLVDDWPTTVFTSNASVGLRGNLLEMRSD